MNAKLFGVVCKYCEVNYLQIPLTIKAPRHVSPTVKKTFMGMRLRRLREERGLNQVALAQALGLSPSYLNQLEQNQRPLTVPVLLKINAAFGVDVQMFSEDDEARMIAGLREVLADGAPQESVSLAEIR